MKAKYLVVLLCCGIVEGVNASAPSHQTAKKLYEECKSSLYEVDENKFLRTYCGANIAGFLDGYSQAVFFAQPGLVGTPNFNIRKQLAEKLERRFCLPAYPLIREKAVATTMVKRIDEMILSNPSEADKILNSPSAAYLGLF